MTEAVAPIHGRRLDARYTLLEKLGAGGQGEVWRAHDETRGVDIALKILTPAEARGEGMWAAFEHEYAIASRLDHASVLKVFPPQRSGEVVVLPMELATGGDLRRLRGAGYLEIIPVLLDIAQALEHAHERGVIHRDLKPGNVLFDARGRVRLADFGAASTTTTSAADARLQGLSPFTASPEQLRGEPPTPGDDIYGLGALSYELLSGYPPYYPHFDAKRAQEEPVPELVPTRQIPPLLSALVMRMLAKRPQERPRSMREVIDELDAALNDTLTFDFEELADPTLSSVGEVTPDRAARLPPPPPSPAVQAAILAGETIAFSSVQSASPQIADAAPSGQRAVPTANTTASSAQREASPASATRPFYSAASSANTAASFPQREAPAAVATRPPHTELPATDTAAAPVERETPPASATRPFRSAASSANTAASFSQRAASTARFEVPPAQTAGAAPNRQSSAPEETAFMRAETPSHRVEEPQMAHANGASFTSEDFSPDAPLFTAAASPQSQYEKRVHSPTRQQPRPAVERAAPAQPPPRPAVERAAPAQPPPRPAAERAPPQPPPQPRPTRAAGQAGGPAGPRMSSERTPWEDLKLEAVPRVTRLEPMRARRRWPIVLLGVLAVAAVAVFYLLPRYAPEALPIDLSAISRVAKNLAPSFPSVLPDTSPAAAGSDANTADETKLQATRESFDRRLAALEARGAGVWGGPEYASAKMRAAESVGAHDAGNTRLAQERLADASRLLDQVDSRAPQALATQLAAGQKALASGQEELANQAFDLARRIDPNDRRISDGQRRTHSLTGVLPLLADAQNAESARNYSRAAQDYSQALSLDPGNDKARSGLARANAAFGDDNYAKAVGSGFAALGAGRLGDAHDAFERARGLRPTGSEAAEGLRRVGAALSARGFASTRQRAAGLEAQERWDEAVLAYNSALQADPSLLFAQEGKNRAAARAELGASMQALIDHPERLASQSVREQARGLLQSANEQSPSGPVLRSQIARLGLLLPQDYDKPVRLSLVSDNATAIAIPSIGQFGTFAKRDIELKPGRYTVIGTRDGFREVHREITIAPGQENQTISVSCSDPI
jgi:serine/threonine protein kinase